MSRNFTRVYGALARLPMASRFFHNEDGGAAIEFGVVALPFFAMLFAIIQTALVFFGGQILETANADAARLIRTGQAQNQSFDAATYKNNVCSRIKGLMNCAGVSIDVKSYQNFSSPNFATPLDADGNLATNTFGFNPGAPGDIVVVRAMYEFPLYVSMWGGLKMANMAGNKRLLIATAAFRNEPFK